MADGNLSAPATLTTQQLAVLQHSLGLDEYGRGPRSRNYFATDPDGGDGAVCASLVERGLMKDRGQWAIADGMHCFVVTPEGIAAVERESPRPPKVSRGRQRYLDWLDADSGMPFGEWLRTRKEADRG